MSFLADSTDFYIDGYDYYLQFIGRDPVVTTFAGADFPANRTVFSFVEFREFVRSQLDTLGAFIFSLDLTTQEKAEIQQLFKYGRILVPNLKSSSRSQYVEMAPGI